MKKLLIAAVILAAAVACGEASSSSQAHQPLALSNGSAQQAADKSTAALPPGRQTYAVNQPARMPIQGPLVIRQAQLTVSVASGSFDSKLSDVRQLVELEQGFIAGTDAQVNPQLPDDRIRTGVISFMVPAKNFDETIDGLANSGKVQ